MRDFLGAVCLGRFTIKPAMISSGESPGAPTVLTSRLRFREANKFHPCLDYLSFGVLVDC